MMVRFSSLNQELFKRYDLRSPESCDLLCEHSLQQRRGSDLAVNLLKLLLEQSLLIGKRLVNNLAAQLEMLRNVVLQGQPGQQGLPLALSDPASEGGQLHIADLVQMLMRLQAGLLRADAPGLGAAGPAAEGCQRQAVRGAVGQPRRGFGHIIFGFKGLPTPFGGIMIRIIKALRSGFCTLRGDPYYLLGVSREATLEEVKKSFYKMAAEYHPDVNPAPASIKHFLLIK